VCPPQHPTPRQASRLPEDGSSPRAFTGTGGENLPGTSCALEATLDALARVGLRYAFVQFLQSVELAGTLLATTPVGRPVIALGDFNSSPLDPLLGPIVPTYQVMTGSGFEDIWETNLLASWTLTASRAARTRTWRTRPRSWTRGSTSSSSGTRVRSRRWPW
jgi:hypothetical protein